MLIGDFLTQSALRFPERAALVAGSTRLDYRTLEAAANRFAHALHAAGLRKGDKVAIMCRNVPDYPIVYFGAAKSGCVLVNLSVRYTADELVYVLGKTEAKLLAVEAGFLDTLAAARPRLPALERMVLIGDTAAPPADAVSLDDFLAGQPDHVPDVDIAETDPLGMTYTGGTTGFPKGVLVSHKARVHTVLTCLAEFGLDERDVVAVITPLFHCVGLSVWYQPAVALGATCALLPAWDAGAFMDMVESHGVSAAFFVPTQLNDLVKHPDFDPARLKTLRKVGFAGSVMAVTLMETLLDRLPEIAFTEHYGQSETGPIAVRPPWALRAKIGAVGRQALGVEIRVADPEGRTLPVDEVGEIVTRGDHLLSEYYREPEETRAIFKSGDGWLWTGDLGRMDEDGYITLVDRSKDMIITGGENVYPAEIENALYAHQAVSECAVFGIPDERLGEVAAAAVVLEPGAQASAEELAEFCATRIARFKRPRRVDFMDALPKTAVGKVQRNVLKAPYWQGHERKI